MNISARGSGRQDGRESNKKGEVLFGKQCSSLLTELLELCGNGRRVWTRRQDFACFADRDTRCGARTTSNLDSSPLSATATAWSPAYASRAPSRVSIDVLQCCLDPSSSVSLSPDRRRRHNRISRSIPANIRIPRPLSFSDTVTMSAPHFWSTPLRYLRWASYEKPAIFYSIIVGSMGPVALVTLPPIRRFFGDVDPEPIPLTYPSKEILFLSAR